VETGVWLSEAASHWLDSPLEGGFAAGRGRVEAGTAKSLLSFLSRDGPPPTIWPGVAVRPVDEGQGAPSGLTGDGAAEEEARELEILPSTSRCAVVVWPAGTPAERADPARIPATLLPAGLSLQVVVLWGAEPAFCISGERFRGRVLK
jgi:hypothetical protein